MRFGLLAIDRETLSLAAEIARDPRHEVVWSSAANEIAPTLANLVPRVSAGDDWETLLDGDIAEAVVVGRVGDEEQRADQLRKLIQAAVPLVVAHPAHSSMLVCYELEMIRQTTGCLMLPYHPARFSTAVRRLAEQVLDQAVLGSLEQVIFERWLAERGPEQVRAIFAQDMDLARLLAGDLTRLSAMAPTSEPAGYANLGVQLSGPTSALVRWSVGPLEHAAGGRLTAIGAGGRAILQMPSDGSTWRLEIILPERSSVEEFAAADGAAAALERFSRLTAGDKVAPEWSDACRAVELADSIQRSLEKGRTVELHSEDYTEENTFKGTMTSLGCGLLSVSFLVLVVGVIAAGFRFPLADYWPHFLLLLLGCFLLLQLLRFAFPGTPSK